MKVRLFSRVKVEIVDMTPSEAKHSGHKFIFDQVSGKCKVYVPVEAEEELLGEFFAEPAGKWIIVHGKRDVRVDAEILVSETRVNVFRVEIL